MNEVYKKYHFQSWKWDIEQKIPKTLEEYLDWYTFVNYSEVFCAVEDYYVQLNEDEHTSYWELSEYWEKATEYCIDRWILWFDEAKDLKEQIEELEDFDYWYNESDNYMKACEICWTDPRENCDFVDDECIIEDVRRRAEEWDLQWIKNVLEDIDLSDSYFMYDWYWRPRNIDRSDVESVIDDKLRELKTEYENLIDILQSGE